MTVTMNDQPGQQLTPRVPAKIGQATAVEQSRAVAEVHAAIVVAQQCPRSLTRALAQMRESCAQQALADRAFFRYPRSGSTVSGPSVHLARELARTWGNVQFGIAELVRDDGHGQSEMLAFAWDVETNTRSSNTFIVPHMRDTREGAKQLTDMRDIYENNANNGARRLREAIFSILPPWFVEEAKDLCNKTLTDGGGKPLPQRIADAIRVFGALGVTPGQMEVKVGSARDQWTEHDVAQLGVIYKSLERGEIRKEEEFAPERLTMADLTGQDRQDSASGSPRPAPGETNGGGAAKQSDRETPRPQGNGASRLVKMLSQIPLGPAADVTAFIAWRTGRDVTRLRDLTAAEVDAVVSYLEHEVTEAGGDRDKAAGAIWEQYNTGHQEQQQ